MVLDIESESPSPIPRAQKSPSKSPKSKLMRPRQRKTGQKPGPTAKPGKLKKGGRTKGDPDRSLWDKFSAITELAEQVERQDLVGSSRNRIVFSNTLGKQVWTVNLCRWWNQSVRERWSAMFEDETLTNMYGKSWYCTRKQAPNVWKQRLLRGEVGDGVGDKVVEEPKPVEEAHGECHAGCRTWPPVSCP